MRTAVAAPAADEPERPRLLAAIATLFRRVLTLRPVAETCARCAEISATPALDLIYFWSPTWKPTEQDGEIVRALALAEHAKWGHPTPSDYLR